MFSNVTSIIMIVLFVVIMGLAAIGWFEHDEITGLNQQIATADAQKAACDAANATWKAQADQQTAAIAKLKALMKTRAAAAAAAIAKTTQARREYDALAAKVEAQTVDKDDCKGANQVLQSYLQSTTSAGGGQ